MVQAIQKNLFDYEIITRKNVSQQKANKKHVLLPAKTCVQTYVCITASETVPFLVLFPRTQVNLSFTLDLPVQRCCPAEIECMTKEVFHECMKNVFF